MKLQALVDTADRVRRRGKRLDKLTALAELLSSLEPADIEVAVSFLSGELPFGKIGIGHTTVREALQAAADPHPETQPARLTLEDVSAHLSEIAGTAGAGSKKRRSEILSELFTRSSESERSFLARLLVGELRQGALEGIMIDALARATEIDLGRLRRAVMITGDLRRVAIAALTGGAPALEQFRVQVFQPLQPMLAQPAQTLDEACWRASGKKPVEDQSPTTDSWQQLSLELKIDGARVQVHRRDDHVQVFTRSLNEVSASVPEVVELTRGLPCRELILDGEAFVFGRNGLPVPFQLTMRRFGRKLDIDEQRRKLPLTVRFFDCLYLDGEDLLDLPLAERWRRLAALVPDEAPIERVVPADQHEATAFLDRAIRLGHEGVMVKALASSYEAGRRGYSWLKVKPTHTLDLVVLAVEWGSGRRRGKLSNLHLGARDPEGGGFVMLGKTFKGLTDKLLTWQTEKLLDLRTEEQGHVVHVRPELVVEIAFNNIQASPQYPAGMALRFARVKRYREDKTADQASTLDEVRAIFEGENPGAGPGASGGDSR